MKHAPVIYLETSVFGFYADELPRNRVHSDAVRKLFDQIETGMLDGVTSRVTVDELSDAPSELRRDLMDLLRHVRICDVDDEEAGRLADRYVAEGIIPVQYMIDASHVAYATVARVDVLVTLNLQHIANEWAARRVNAVNMDEGYPLVSIRTPAEVIRYEG